MTHNLRNDQKSNTLLIATKNAGKAKEMKKSLFDLPIAIVTALDLEETKNLNVKETGNSLKENAQIKAKAYGEVSGLLTIADDSGLEIQELEGFPGVKSARFAKGSDRLRNKKILDMLSEVPEKKRKAVFRAVIALFAPETKEVKTFEAATAGKITTKELGNRGFGYDPIFFSDELGRTFAQATLEEKNRVSHRARALAKAKSYLNTFLTELNTKERT